MGRGGSVAVGLAALLAAGCGSSTPPSEATTGGFAPSAAPATTPSSIFETIAPLKPVDPSTLRAALVRQVQAQVPAGTAVTANCPSAPTAARTTVHCAVTIAGTAVDWLVTNLDGSSVDSEPAVGLLRVADARAAVARTFSDYADPAVDCGPGVVVVVKVDDELDCRITSGERQNTAHVVVTDAHGHFQVTP